MKPPPQNANKDPNTQGANGRKTSVSHGQGNAFNTSSPASSRPSTRRQQTADSISALNSPIGSRFNRDDSSPFFSRKFTDSKDPSEDRVEDTKPSLPFGGLIRSNTASALTGGPASPWGTGSAAMSPMGNFGSFPIGQPGIPPTPTEKRPGFGSMRGESRLAHLMPKESSEDIASKAAERQWRPRQRTDTDPFGDEPSGSAALGGGRDNSPPDNSQRRAPGLDTPVRGNSSDFGMTEVRNFRDELRGVTTRHTPHKEDHEPMSPADTNPYRSPHNPREADDGNYDDEPIPLGRGQGLGGIPEHVPNPFSNPRNFSAGIEEGDRSQTSSVGGTKGFPALSGLHTLGNLGAIGGWPTSGNPIGTPDREHRGFPGAFGNTLFGGMDNVQSPSLGPIGGMFGQGSSSNLGGTAGRGSKLGSLFPAAMQAQMHVNENENAGEGGERQNNGFGAIGRGGFPPRDTDSPMRAGRHPFEDLFPQTDSSRVPSAFSSHDLSQSQTATAFAQSAAQTTYQQSQGSSDSASNQLPPAQQRMMVMPDRMRWVYLDPQGQIQGPWSGLEMHDWYKASFFTADLSVRKVEDTEFEPLGQLIRRIGNSREPFLVPQIGIPHGPAAPPAGTPFTPAAATPGNTSAQAGSVQPPFAGAFPSFGTTLTAEQQNNLERRKQEEQYLMARQREFLAQQQVNMRQMQAMPSALHHHSSAHSLHSQPSLNNIASPIGMGAQSHMPGVAGFFDNPPRQMPSQVQGMPNDFFREDDLSRLNIQDRQQLFGSVPVSQQQTHAQQIASMFPQNVDAARETSRLEQMNHDDPQGYKARLREFNQYQKENEAEEAAQAAAFANNDHTGAPQPQQQEPQYFEEPQEVAEVEEEPEPKPEVLSLTQQVQKAASAKNSPVNVAQPESPWGKVATGLPMPFPPPQSTTPLPAPNPQRNRANLPESLVMESSSRSETPEISIPSVAPWAKEPAGPSKGPSLKEIQETEAKKAAIVEEAAAAARRAQNDLEMKILNSQQSAAPAPGLPTSSTWGNTASPSTPTGAPSPWSTKPVVSKSLATSSSAAGKKTLADIQREEESRKAKLAAANAANAQPVQGPTGGKRYADLASKPSAPQLVGGSAWNTVGAGGKVKVPTGPSVPSSVRTASTAIPLVSSSRIASRPVAANRSVSAASPSGAVNANEEFTKWAKAELAKGLNTGMDGM